MALSLSTDRVDETGRELLVYGTPAFPIAFFDDDLTQVTVPPHWHDEFEIVIVTKGIVHVRIAGTLFTLSAGEGYFANSGILHAGDLKTKTGHQHALVFSPKIISRGEDLIWQSCVAPVFKNPRLPYVRLSPSEPWKKEILQLADKAWDQGAYDKENYPLQVRHCLSQAFSLLAAHRDIVEGELLYASKYQRDEVRMKKMLLFIEKNYAEEISMDAIAQSAEISISTCLRLFKRALGTTPVGYLIGCRLQKAAEELKRMDGKSIAEIAYSCGFSDASYFNRCFRKTYAMTPTEYRTACRQGTWERLR